jgi:hypothetical protein
MQYTLRNVLGVSIGLISLATLLSGCDSNDSNRPTEPAADPAAEKAAEDAVIELGGLVRRADDVPGRPVVFVSLVRFNQTPTTDEDVRLIQPMTQVREVVLNYCPEVTDAGLAHLKDLVHIQNLALHGTKVTDAGLENLAAMTKMKHLDLVFTRVRGPGLCYLVRMTDLKYLSLQGAPVEDEGLVHLKGLTNLEELDLYKTRVTGQGLVHLKELKGLKRLQVPADIPQSEIDDLRAALPNTRIPNAR